MRLNDYTLCMVLGEMPCYLWMEGMDKEVYYVDEQTCDDHLFGGNYDIIDHIGKRWFKIMRYKPRDLSITCREDLEKCKWSVTESYTEYFNDIDDDNTDYEKYELDFEKHCVKKY